MLVVPWYTLPVGIFVVCAVLENRCPDLYVDPAFTWHAWKIDWIQWPIPIMS
jgi:hypothetical protein